MRFVSSVKILDLGEARRYLRGIRSLSDEASRSSETRVILLALKVLARQPAEIRRLLRRIA